MIDRDVASHLNAYNTSGAELIVGNGRFVASKTITLSDGSKRVLVGDKVILNVDTPAAIPGIPGLEAVRPVTHIEALELKVLPQHLVVLGGGYVGLEMPRPIADSAAR
jgi:pyruvate/2-oxoglutarate dehydrogenase complex dihydrolipoamide dehydrogenase (E3) component